jgi:hypothetical protein
MQVKKSHSDRLQGRKKKMKKDMLLKVGASLLAISLMTACNDTETDAPEEDTTEETEGTEEETTEEGTEEGTEEAPEEGTEEAPEEETEEGK